MMPAKQVTFSMQDREGVWLNTFVSLFVALLAFFILIANMIYLETSLPKRNFQKMQHDVYLQAVKAKQRMRLDWLDIEETVTKGTRLTLRAEQLKGKEVFRVGSDKISPEWQGELQSLAILIDQLGLNDLNKRYAKWSQGIQEFGFEVSAHVQIEGHTDDQPMKSARFPSNWELSTARALAMQQFLQQRTQLSPHLFGIAGLGSFHPAGLSSEYNKNCRIEIYLGIEMRKRGS